MIWDSCGCVSRLSVSHPFIRGGVFNTPHSGQFRRAPSLADVSASSTSVEPAAWSMGRGREGLVDSGIFSVSFPRVSVDMSLCTLETSFFVREVLPTIGRTKTSFPRTSRNFPVRFKKGRRALSRFAMQSIRNMDTCPSAHLRALRGSARREVGRGC
jgi:hypothetical protein